MRIKLHLVSNIMLFLLLVSCVSPYQEQVNNYNAVKQNVSLGMDMYQAMRILPTPEKTESYMHNNKVREIIYIRSNWISDNKLTDDEVTPYIFEDKKLIGIGWAMLGGAKSTGTPSTGSTYCYEFWNEYMQMYQIICN